jgi:ParB-like chromosome segregation protein Spo0J
VQIKSESIELVSVDALIPHPKNMHNHPPEQIERLCKLIEYQGFRTPLTVQRGTNLIVTGHGRLMAAKKLGMEKVPVTYQEFDDEAQLYAHIVADNAIGKDTWATLDLSQINLDIQDLGPELDIDMLGLKNFTVEASEKNEDKEIELSFEYKLEVDCIDEITQQQTMAELVDRGLKVRVLL